MPPLLKGILTNNVGPGLMRLVACSAAEHAAVGGSGAHTLRGARMVEAWPLPPPASTGLQSSTGYPATRMLVRPVRSSAQPCIRHRQRLHPLPTREIAHTVAKRKDGGCSAL